MKVIVPIFPECVLASYTGILDILNYTTSFQEQLTQSKLEKPLFEVYLTSVTDSKHLNHNGLDVSTGYSLENTPKPDLIIVPAFLGNVPEVLNKYDNLVQWLKWKSANGVEISSSCTGGFFLAKAGLLDGKEATTSWFSASLFKQLFPKVHLQEDKMLVDAGKCITGGATYSYLHLCLYLIEKYYGKRLSNYCARLFLVERGNDSQKPYQSLNNQNLHQDDAIKKVQLFIEAQNGQVSSITALSELVSMSERNFVRRFKEATGTSPVEYIQSIKIENAKAMLEENSLSVKEVCYEIGYEDLSHFRKLFKRNTGLTPTEYRERFAFKK